MTQPEFDFQPLFSDVAPRIVESFVDFHRQAPEIYDLFKRFAQELQSTGCERYGAAAIFERIRWHMTVEKRDGAFKLNNNFRSCYSRLLAFEDPRFRDFFETRQSRNAA